MPIHVHDSDAEMSNHASGPDQLVPAQHAPFQRRGRGAQRRHVQQLSITEALQHQEWQQPPHATAFRLEAIARAAVATSEI